MANATYSWAAGAGGWNDASQWTLVGGVDDSGYPHPGDTAIINAGTILALDDTFNANTIDLNAGTLHLFNDTTIVGFSSFDAATTLTAGSAELDSFGGFVNYGTLAADGATGTAFTINIDANGTLPGYFINYGQIGATSGHSLTIAIGANAELFNVGQIIANGGSVLITAAPGAIVGGYAPSTGFALIEAGGTLELNAGYPASANGSPPFFAFDPDGSSGNTLKLDQAAQFGGRILGFATGDTIDLGTSLAVGTFAVSGGIADGFTITTGADGNTELTTGTAIDIWANSSATSPFTVTTGSAPVTVASLVIASDYAVLQVTSNAKVGVGAAFTGPSAIIGYAIEQIAGAIEITSGDTPSGQQLRQFTLHLVADRQPRGTRPDRP